jgi:hypothetical protein
MAMALLAGCGNGPSSFVGRASNSVIYVDWTRDHSRVEGTFRQALIKPEEPGSVDEKSASFSGTINDADVTLRIGGELLGSNITGELDGSTLELHLPGGEGGVISVRLKEGGADEYNAGLADLRAEADQANADQAAAQAKADQAQEVVDHADRVRADIETLTKAADSSGDNFDGDLGTIRDSLETVKQSLELVKQDVEEGETDVVCSDADVVQSDAEVLDGDIEGTIGSDRDLSGADAVSVRNTIRTLRSDFDVLGSDPTDLLPADAASQDDVNRAVSDARNAIRTTRSAGSDSLAEARKLQAEAHGYAAAAKALCRQHG